MRHFIVLFLTLLLFNNCGLFAQNISLNGQWQFKLAKSEKEAGKYSNFYTEDFKASNFNTIKVPSNWAMQGFEDPIYARPSASEGFYLHKFTVPKSWGDQRVLLHFGGVWSSAEVWLNGHRLGRHDSGFTGFAFDVTNELRLGEENLLAVRVRQATRENPFDDNDDWALAGIYRNVWLEPMPQALYIDKIIAKTTISSDLQQAHLNLQVMAVQWDDKKDYALKVLLTDKSGKVVADAERNKQASGRRLRAIRVRKQFLTWT